MKGIVPHTPSGQNLLKMLLRCRDSASKGDMDEGWRVVGHCEIL